MKWISNQKIAFRLIAAFLIVALLTLAVGVISIDRMDLIHKEYDVLYQDYGVAQGTAGNIAMHFRNIRITLRDIVLIEDPAKQQEYSDKIKQMKIDLNEQIDALGKTYHLEEEKAQHLELITHINTYYDIADKITRLALSGITADAARLIYSTEVADITAKADASVEEAVARKQRDGKLRDENLESSVHTMEGILWAIIAGSFLAAIAIGFLSSRSISKPMGRLLAAARQVASGRTDIEIDIQTKDEVGVLASAFRSMINTLRGMVSDARALAEASVIGDLHIRADSSRHQGDFKIIIDGVNKTLDTLVGHINAIPSPVLIIDREHRIRYLNQAAAQMVGKSQETARGMMCHELFMTSDCGTANCACAKAMQMNASNHNETSAHPNGLNLDLSYVGVPVLDADGHVVGAMKAITDLTDIRKAQRVADKQTQYQALHVDRLMKNLERLAAGDLSCDMKVSLADQDTDALHQLFTGICDNLHSSFGAIRSYIEEITDTLGKMASGNMDTGIDREYLGDFMELKDSINKIVLALNDTLNEINHSAEQVASGTQQVAAGSQALSQGATEQASATEQLTASLTEIAAQTRQNALSAGEASELAQTAKQDALDGDSRMDQLQKAMAEINESSTSISRIIKVIDEIAFQTNLLALNAAVEAARAGQHGKGFAVVAEEVRSLAQRSANAAKETTQLIEESIKKVKYGTRIANDTAQALSRIVGGVQKATDLIGSIASASNEQAMAVAQINNGVEQVSQVTQTNSATAEESAAASEELSSQAAILKDMVGRFTLRGQSRLSGQRGVFQPVGDGRDQHRVGHREFGKY